MLGKKTFVTPNRKVRNNLVEAGNIKEMHVRQSENKRAIMEKLHQLIPSYTWFSFLKVTSGKDLIAASPSQDDEFGGAIVKLTDECDLYVAGNVDCPVSTSPSQQQLSDNLGQQLSPTPTSLAFQQQVGNVSQQLSPTPSSKRRVGNSQQLIPLSPLLQSGSK